MNINLSSCRLSNQGFTIIELAVAGVIGLAGLGAAAGIYSYVARQNHAMETRRALADISNGIKQGLGQDLKSAWATKICPTAPISATVPSDSFPSFSGGEFTAHLLNNSNLTNATTGLLPALIPGTTTPNPLYTAIMSIQSSGAAACTLSTSPATAIIRASAYNLLLCKCALVQTAYPTLQTAVTFNTSTTATGFYSCIALRPSGSSASTTMQQLLNQGTVIIESITSVMSVTDGSSFSCKAIATPLTAAQKLQSTSRLDYTLLFQATGSAESTSIPNSLIME